MFLNCSTCFERHTAHHQELKNCNLQPLILHTFVVAGSCHGCLGTRNHDSCRRPQTYVKTEAANYSFLSSWWWAACRPKHVEQLRNIGIINSTTRSRLVGYFYKMCVCVYFGKFNCPCRRNKYIMEMEVQLRSFLTLSQFGAEWPASRTGALPRGRNQGAYWITGSVGSQSLYELTEKRKIILYLSPTPSGYLTVRLRSAVYDVCDLVFHQSSMDCKQTVKDEWNRRGNMLIRRTCAWSFNIYMVYGISNLKISRPCPSSTPT